MYFLSILQYRHQETKNLIILIVLGYLMAPKMVSDVRMRASFVRYHYSAKAGRRREKITINVDMKFILFKRYIYSIIQNSKMNNEHNPQKVLFKQKANYHNCFLLFSLCTLLKSSPSSRCLNSNMSLSLPNDTYLPIHSFFPFPSFEDSSIYSTDIIVSLTLTHLEFIGILSPSYF